ncbi:MAG TPA: YncE family protein, partial [Candidatus Limnocylindrales bacterium]|nr:YncE family protein [Candidatus Limnocylindrales bacterium]
MKLVCESADRIATVRFGPGGAAIEKTTETRILQSDISGPHGIAFSPDKKNFFVTIGHGRPYGTALKYETATDRVLKQVGLGLFPATADVTPDGNFLFAVNFNLHGDPVPSSVSVVDTNEMAEVARIPTCIMPHGSRISRDGRHQYSACMMNDLLVEIDTEAMKVSRSFRVSAGKEQGYAGIPQEKMEHHEGMPMNMAAITCSPTWAQPSSDGSRVYVACNKSNEIVEIETKEWKLVRRIPAG